KNIHHRPSIRCTFGSTAPSRLVSGAYPVDMLNRTSGWLVFIVRLRSVSRCRRKLHMVFAVGTENGSRSFGVSRPALLLFAHGQVSGGRFAAIHGRTAGGGAVGARAEPPAAGADPSYSRRGRHRHRRL